MLRAEARAERLCAPDFAHMTGLGITIQERRFEHLVCHFVPTYSNWETGMVCCPESLGSLSEGWRKAVWELGAVAAGEGEVRVDEALRKLPGGKSDGFAADRHVGLIENDGEPAADFPASESRGPMTGPELS